MHVEQRWGEQAFLVSFPISHEMELNDALHQIQAVLS